MDLQLPVQSVPVTTIVVSSNPVHDEVYSIQHYVIKFVSDLRQVSCFFPGILVSSTNKTDCQDITEILLKVALNTINQIKHMTECLQDFIDKTLQLLYPQASLHQ